MAPNNQNQQGGKPNPVEKLEQMLTFKPGGPNLTNDVIQEALKEIKEERAAEAKKHAKEQLKIAMEVHEAITALEKEVSGKINKKKKELAGIMGKLQAAANGQPVEDDDNE